MSTSSVGRNLEHDIRKMFVDNGWDCIRGAGSKGEVFGFKTDLCFTRTRTKYQDTITMQIISFDSGESEGDIVNVQCKRKSKRRLDGKYYIR